MSYICSMKNRIRITIFLLLSYSLSACYNQNRDCKRFTEGQFESVVTIDSVVYKSKFLRQGNLQIETFKGITDSASVRWINSCEYILTTLHPKNRSQEKPVHIKLLTTTDSSYTFEYNFVGESLKTIGIANKVD